MHYVGYPLRVNNRDNVKSRFCINSETTQIIVGASADFSLFGIVDCSPGLTIFFAESGFHLNKYERVIQGSNQIDFIPTVMPLFFYDGVSLFHQIGSGYLLAPIPFFLVGGFINHELKIEQRSLPTYASEEYFQK